MRLTRHRAIRVIAAAATAPWWIDTARAQTLPSIRAAMIPIEPASSIYYAADNGFFTKAGIDVQIAQNPSTPALAAAVASGTYDIAYATISTLSIAHSHSLPFVAIAPGIETVPGEVAGAIMVPTASTIKTAKDFNGKTFGCAGLGTIAEYQPRAWIDKNGGDSTTVKFIEIPFPETIAALNAGRIDAAYLVEPFITIATKGGTVRLLATGDDAIGVNFLSTAWYATSQWAAAHPDLVTRFASAMLAAARWANANQDKVTPILVKYLKADPGLVAAAHRAYFAERLLPAQIQPWINVTAKYAKFPPFPATELIYVPK
jgi:ABC-type nitrate/sulfonate/bicarbonate transport system substrate-binding protein